MSERLIIDASDGGKVKTNKNFEELFGSRSGWLSELPDGDPIVIVATGQSNMTVVASDTTSGAMTINPNVYDWQSPDRINSSEVGTDFSFVVADPNRLTSYGSYPFGSNEIMTGMAGQTSTGGLGPRGNIPWSAADLIQKITGRDVYMIQVSQGAQLISAWEPDVGLLEEELTLQVEAALAEIPGSGNYPHNVYWAQGYSDAAAAVPISVYEYSEAFREFKTAMEAKWAVPGLTQWFLNGFVDNAPFTKWEGPQQAAQDAGTDTHFVPCIGLAGWDGEPVVVHLTGAEANQQGRNFGRLSLQGPQAKDRSLIFRPYCAFVGIGNGGAEPVCDNTLNDITAAWAIGKSAGVDFDIATGEMTSIVPGVAKISAFFSFKGTVGKTYTFNLIANGSDTFVRREITVTSATDSYAVSLGTTVDLETDGKLRVQQKINAGTGTLNITSAQFNLNY